MCRVAPAVLPIALCLAVSSPSLAQILPCPNNDIRLYGTTVAQYATASLDTSYTPLAGLTYRVTYDVSAGTLHIEKPIVSGFGYEYVIARDRYDISGLPVGTVVPFTVNLDVNGYVQSADICGGSGCSGFFGATLTQGAATNNQSVSVGFHGRSDLIQTLSLPISITVGTPILIEYQLYYFVQAGGDGYGGTGDGTFRFTGLPAGATLVSCQGYAANLATPTHSVSWGRLKTIYR